LPPSLALGRTLLSISSSSSIVLESSGEPWQLHLEIP
jgi:hypothetical protein